MATKRALHYIALGMAHRLAEEIDKDMGAGGGGGSAGLSLASFGAVPNDPEAANANSEAFREGASAAMEAGVKLVVPSGVFYVPEKILIPAVADLYIDGEPGAVVKGLPGDEYADTDRPMIEIDGGSARPRMTVHNVTFDNSDRIFVPTEQSGTALSLKRLDGVTISDCQFIGFSEDSDLGSGKGDSGATIQECARINIRGCYFYRQPDIGVYLTGGAEEGGSDDGGEAIFTANVFDHCQVAVSAKRESRRTVFSDNICLYCNVGFSLFETGNNTIPGRECTVTGNIFEKTGTRAIDLRASFGDVISGNKITDWGYLPDGVTLSSQQRGIVLQGCEGVSITGNTIALKDWANSNHYAIAMQQFTSDALGTVQSRRNAIWGNRIFGVSRGINEAHSTTDNHGDNWISATVPVSLAAGSGSTYGITATNAVRYYTAASTVARFDRAGDSDGQIIRFDRSGSNIGGVNSDAAGYAQFIGAPVLPTYPVGSLPSASGRQRHLVFVTGEVGGATVAFSDGTNWRRVQDREIVS